MPNISIIFIEKSEAMSVKVYDGSYSWSFLDEKVKISKNFT